MWASSDEIGTRFTFTTRVTGVLRHVPGVGSPGVRLDLPLSGVLSCQSYGPYG